MKVANGGVLHDLFDFSHPQVLGGKPQRPRRNDYLSFSWPTAPLPSRPRPTNQDGPPAASKRDVGTQARAKGGGDRASPTSNSGLVGDGRAHRRGLAVGRRLPRTLVMHGTADATVPFSQTSAVAHTLRNLGVPTVLRFDHGGEVWCGMKRIRQSGFWQLLLVHWCWSLVIGHWSLVHSSTGSIEALTLAQTLTLHPYSSLYLE